LYEPSALRGARVVFGELLGEVGAGVQGRLLSSDPIK
jgi:hypothetical protein